MSSKIIRCFPDPYANPQYDKPAYFVSMHDADDRVNGLQCAYWVDTRTIQYYAKEDRSREDLVGGGTFGEAWKQMQSGPLRISVWQMPNPDSQ